MKIIIIVIGVLIFRIHTKQNNKLKSIVFSVLHGLGSFYAVNFIGGFIGVHININFFTLLLSVIGSVPGVLFMLINQIILKF